MVVFISLFLKVNYRAFFRNFLELASRIDPAKEEKRAKIEYL
jgi:hypothetical protein